VVSERLRSQILQAFNVDIRVGDTVKSGVYHLVDRRGREYCLKRMAYSRAHLRWIEHALGVALQRGFAQFAWGPVAQLPGHDSFFVLTPWLQGAPPFPSDGEALANCAAALAKFHRAGRTGRVDHRGAKRELGQWPAFFLAGQETLRQALTNSGPFRSSRASALGGVLAPYREELLERSVNARQRLAAADYAALVRSARATGSLCHGDSGPANFVVTKNGPHLIDFETLRIDLPVYDLFRMVRLTGKNTDWNFRLTRAILDGYQRVSPLGRADCELLSCWLLFPYKTVKILRRAARTSFRGRDKTVRKLERVLRREAQIRQWVMELDHYAEELG